MNRRHLDVLAWPGGGEPLELDATRRAEGEIVEGFLVDPVQLRAGVVAAGVALLPPDLDAWIRAHGNVIARTPLIDPRVVRRLRRVAGAGHDAVPFEEVTAHYRDLVRDAPDGFDTTAHPDDVALVEALRARVSGRPVGRGLVIGCGVGRLVFELRAFADTVLGLDWSLARVRRARNIAVTEGPFLLPVPTPRAPGTPKEVPIDLEALVRDGVDFVAGDGAALPLADGCCDLIVLAAGDGRGPWADAERVHAEARRVLAPGGILLDATTPDAVA